MPVKKNKPATIHVIAVCRDCAKQWEDYRTAVDRARAHAESTGHSVAVERGQTWTYNPR